MPVRPRTTASPSAAESSRHPRATAPVTPCLPSATRQQILDFADLLVAPGYRNDGRITSRCYEIDLIGRVERARNDRDIRRVGHDATDDDIESTTAQAGSEQLEH